MTANDSHNPNTPECGYAVTIGTFDGVHRGHLRVLDTLRKAAAQRGLRPLAITFDSHPLTVIAPERTPPAIMSTDRKIELLRNEGVDYQLIDFTPMTARMSASGWMRVLHDYQNVKCIVIGFDNTFGHDGRSLSPDDYIRIGAEIGIDVVVAGRIDGISSSAIRRAIGAGEIEKANEMLSEPFTLDGTVVEGDHIGRSLGVPTANLRLSAPDNRLLPPCGVYASETLLPDGRILPSLTDIGRRPTLRNPNPELRIETHIPGFDGDLYGKRIEVKLLRPMRPEMKFDSLDALKKQLHDDIRLRMEN